MKTVKEIERVDTILRGGTVLAMDAVRHIWDPGAVAVKGSSIVAVGPQESIVYNLTSNGNNLKALITFASGNLQIIQVIENRGIPATIKTTSTDTIEMAKDFLHNYKLFSANPLFDQLDSTLNSVDQEGNATKTLGNIVLKQTTYNGYTSFRWYYTCNGVEAEYSKSVNLVFKDGFLSSFADNWQFYKIGNTTVNVSKQDAVATALETTRDRVFSLAKYGLEIKNINESCVRWTKLLFDDSQNATIARSQDLLELHPVWRVGVALDKWYGSMYGVQVDIWADTGEVRAIMDAWSSMPPPEEAPIANVTLVNNSSNASQSTNFANSQLTQAGVRWDLIGFTALSASLVIMVTALSLIQKKFLENTVLKRRHRLIAFLLCFLILAPLPFIGASSPKNGIIWGSESAGAYGYDLPFGPSWRKSSYEVTQQQSTAGYIQGCLANAGYGAYNNQGENGETSNKNSILSSIQSYSAFNNRTIFVDFDHGNGNYFNGISYTVDSGEFHFCFEDQVGTKIGTVGEGNHDNAPQNAVYDREIFERVTSGTTVLAFINACNSASLTLPGSTTSWQGQEQGGYGARGLPFAFTHGRTVVDGQTPNLNVATQMSDDAYFDPDDGCQVFIGFWMGSASLSQNMPLNGGTHQYYEWVEKFFNYATQDDISINSALNQASLYLYTMDFANPNNPLRSFTAYWWMGDNSNQYGTGSLRVYGNGRIQLNSFGDDFNDGNFNGWTVLQQPGAWSASTGALRSSGSDALIRTDVQFTTDRFVRAKVVTTLWGSYDWNVAWVMAKYIDNNNKVYGLIDKSGRVEISLFKNGQQYISQTSTSVLRPWDQHTIDVNVVGNKGWVCVDGVEKISLSSSYFDDFGGYSCMYTSSGAQAFFDDVTVVEQDSSWPTTCYKLTVLSNTGGSTSPQAGEYKYFSGTQAQVSAYANSGCSFSHWHIDGTDAGTENPKTLTMNGPHTIQPQFNLPSTYLTIDRSYPNGGYTNPDYDTYSVGYGTDQVITIIGENPGYDFSHWHVNGVDAGTSTTLHVTMNGDRTVQPQWTTVAWIHVCNDPSYGGHTDRDGYNQGQGYLTITAIPDEGWHIKEWQYATVGSEFEYFAGDDPYINVEYAVDGCWILPVFEQDEPSYSQITVYMKEDVTQQYLSGDVYKDWDYWGTTDYEYGYSDYVTNGVSHFFEASSYVQGASPWYILLDGEFYDYGNYINLWTDGPHTITFVYIWQK